MAEVIVEMVVEKVKSLIHGELGLPVEIKIDLKMLSTRLSDTYKSYAEAERLFMNKKTAYYLKMVKDAAYDASDVVDELEIQQSEKTESMHRGTTTITTTRKLSAFNSNKYISRGMGKEIKNIIKTIDEIPNNSLGPRKWVSPLDGYDSTDDNVEASFRSSYHGLPSNLRQCLGICSIFPKGHQMKKDELIGLWIANDFIQPRRGMDLEDIGNQIFNELLQQSFFHDLSKDTIDNTVSTCKMHDAMHKVASKVMYGECVTMTALWEEVENTIQVKNIRHLSLTYDDSVFYWTCLNLPYFHPLLRTLLFFPKKFMEEPHLFNFSRLRCLRVLNLSGMHIQTLPPSVCDLKHLKYLDISRNDMTLLPESIKNLTKLQVLDVSENKELTTLPLSVGDFQCLRFFSLSQCPIMSLPESIQCLSNLKKLDVSKNYSLETLPLSIGNLRCLSYFNISDCSLLSSLPESIQNLSNLNKLDLSGNRSLTTLPPSIGHLQSLSYLNLSDCSLLSFLPEFVQNLDSLRYLNLAGCRRITSLPGSIPSLRNLQSLILRGCVTLRELPDTLRNMSSLRHLDINRCDKLTNIPKGIGRLTALQTLNHFMVGRSDSSNGSGGISVLHGLNQLRGKLRIEGLENVKSSKDAKKANLRSKKDLTELILIWRSCFRDDSLRANNSKKVLEGLGLPPKLHELEISGYPGANPEGFLKNSKAIQYLKIISCNGLVSFPDGLHRLKSLVQLEIYFCNSLTCLSKGLRSQTSLQKLLIVGCPELELIKEDILYLISLRSLIIQGLPKLRALPDGVRNLTKLQHLGIQGCENLRKLPEWLQHLSALQSFSLSNCHPELHRRCEKEGECWPFISHVPKICIS